MQQIGRVLFYLGCALVVAACAANNRPLQLISGEGPHYPQHARAQGVEGQVTVIYVVDGTGRVLDARIVDSQPEGLFDEAALAAVRSWRFKPPVIDGVIQQSTQRQSTVTFQLGGTSDYDNY